MDREDIGETVAGIGAAGCALLWTTFGCLAQIGAAVIGLVVVVTLFRACVG